MNTVVTRTGLKITTQLLVAVALCETRRHATGNVVVKQIASDRQHKATVAVVEIRRSESCLTACGVGGRAGPGEGSLELIGGEQRLTRPRRCIHFEPWSSPVARPQVMAVVYPWFVEERKPGCSFAVKTFSAARSINVVQREGLLLTDYN